MKELLKHLPAIKGFIEERTTAFQEISDNVLKNFLKEAYKLPFLFPVRIIVSEDKFVNFLFDMRKDLFEGKKIEVTDTPEEIKQEVSSKEVEVETKEKKPVVKKEVVKTDSTKTAKTTITKTKSNVVAKDTKTTTANKKTTTTTAKKTKPVAKKEKLVS